MLAAGAAVMELRNEYAIWGDSQGVRGKKVKEVQGVERSDHRGFTWEGKGKITESPQRWRFTHKAVSSSPATDGSGHWTKRICLLHFENDIFS